MKRLLGVVCVITLLAYDVICGGRAAAQEGTVFSVRDFGARGDGLIADTPGFVAALEAVNAAGGGTLYIPEGKYMVDSAALGALPNDALTVTASNVTIRGAGVERVSIKLTGSTNCTLFYARCVDNLMIENLTVIGLGEVVECSQFVACDNAGASDNHHGFYLRDCRLENFRSAGWITITVYAGEYTIEDIRIEDNVFQSYRGNMFGDGGPGIASDFIRIYDRDASDTGIVNDFIVSGNVADCKYIKRFLMCMRGARNGEVCHNRIYSSGVAKGTDSVHSYAIGYYGFGVSGICSYDNSIYDPWTCGFYAVSGSDLHFWDNYIEGQVDTKDSGLNVGAYALGNVRDVSIRGGAVVDCAIGIQVQPDGMNANITIDGVRISNCGVKGIQIREHATYAVSGGVTITDCTLEGSELRIYRGEAARLADVTIDRNVIQDGFILLQEPVYGAVISGNQIYTTTQAAAVQCNGGTGLTITGNYLHGPGPLVPSTHGLCINTRLMNPSVIRDNVVVGFYHGIRAPYAEASLHSNTIRDVTEIVEDMVQGDLGRDAPDTIPDTVTGYWEKGQFVENLYPIARPEILGWEVTSPARGVGCTSTVATTADMTYGETVVTDVAAIERYIPGAAIELANAARGSATLSTVVLSWCVTYTNPLGEFQKGETVEGATSRAFGVVVADDGRTALSVTGMHFLAGAFMCGETIRGQQSGATATIDGIALEVADPCGNTVNDAPLNLVPPTWRAVRVGESLSEFIR